MEGFLLDGEELETTHDIKRIERAIDNNERFWLDLGDNDEGKRALLAKLGIHPLVIEDIWQERALPKVEDFSTYLYILVHGVRRGSKPEAIDLVELDIVLGPTWVITHQHGSRSVSACKEELVRGPRLRKKGPVWIVHALLDHLVDHYVPLLDQMDEELAQLEETVLKKAGTRHDKGLMARLLAFKRALMKLRRVSGYQRDILLRLSRREFDEIPDDAAPFYRDVYDHFARVTDLADGYRELVQGAMEAYLSVQSNRMNEVMKRLTLISTMMLPLTFIAGVYGMNFDHMPELHWGWGYPFALLLMLGVAVGVISYFRSKHWL